MTIGIYCIENTVDGKKYIGKSICIEKRFNDHKKQFRKETYSNKCNRHLWSAVQKHGMNNFRLVILEKFDVVDDVLLADREVYWMDFHKSLNREYGYNLKRDSSGKTIVSEETRKLMSIASSGRVASDETRRKQSETRKEMCKSDEARKRLSEISKMKVYTPEYRAKISLNNKGKKFSEEHKRKIRESNTGKTNSTEQIIKFTESRSVYSYEQYSLDGVFIQVFLRAKDLVEQGFSVSNVSTVCNGKANTYKGFKWVKIPKIVLTTA